MILFPPCILAIPIGAARPTVILRRTGHAPESVAFMGAFGALTTVAVLVVVASFMLGVGEGVVILPALLLALSCILLCGLALWVAFKPWPMNGLAAGGVRPRAARTGAWDER